ncbi:hypothetical protein TEA_012719 [Camellia sinensis var. sinensis]|uniref:Remorin C-terminal domain-containing protein n=1 Tax=Camellia sinensis var. sinensis TaxID=542762 RepID=A0A4S4E0B2_CAMSN|nr:hypothetical protein TEA_012719 [Camellia sinensis var. sinensis]
MVTCPVFTTDPTFDFVVQSEGDYNAKLGITILGEAVTVEDKVVVTKSIVLPNKTLNVSVQEDIILAYKKLSAIGSWENSKKACVEAQLKKMEEKIEMMKAEYTEKMKNKAAEIHKAAEEKRAMIEAKRGEDVLKVEEVAAKFRATGNTPKRFFGCFSY